MKESNTSDKERPVDLCKEAAWKTADPFVYRLLKENRKEMRDHMTEAEGRLWDQLKCRKLGVKFRRQHMILGFIADFVSLSCRLIIEVDGGIHNDQKEYDENRTFLLNERGFHVIRFTNEEVLQDMESVIEKIKENIGLCTPSQHTDPSRPPQSGEEW